MSWPDSGPYKGAYSIGEFLAQMRQSSSYKNYKAANPNEAAAIEGFFAKKIAGESYMFPLDVAKTFFGKALVMAFLTMPAEPRAMAMQVDEGLQVSSR